LKTNTLAKGIALGALSAALGSALAFDVTPGNNGDWINGLDVVGVPEPATFVALGIAILSLARRRSR